MILRSLLAAALLAMAPASALASEELPFLGTWDCEVATFTFTPTTYDNGSEEMPIEEVQEGSDGSYTLLFADDYFITLSGFTGDTMGWFSPASGDNFSCTRTD
ncbi:hypothetical protein [Aurantimonas sp. HBX-1]|uniref:hypothetical protein n=1 Tax=Aurantimonas sp. HBX-1 TaxID=2906072 RepID=UPI001F3938F8|nr:hypothetical protein [Aurantimonas sp. HBX-1]UIJ73542.1 hypothetical protein LXB15_07900 [Aurantimonas sp. HBX-1]